MSATKLLWISRMGYQCSYSYVSNIFLKNLNKYLIKNPKDLEIYVFCIGIVNEEKNVQEISSYTGIAASRIYIIKDKLINSPNDEDQEYFNNYFSGIYHLPGIIEKVNPDLIITLDDTSVIENQLKILNGIDVELIPYIAVDHVGSGFNLLKNPKVKRVLTMTEFGSIEISKNFKKEIFVLPHIVEPETFYPIPFKTHKGVPTGNFTVGAFNANNIRKRWDILLEGFGMFAQKYNDTHLLIKTTNINPSIDKNGLTKCAEYKLQELIDSTSKKYNISQNRIKIIEGAQSDKELNLLYNSCNIGLTTGAGEGFGLTPCEMSLCEIPQLAPNNTSFPEIFGDGYDGLMPTKKYPTYLGRDIGIAELAGLSDRYMCIYKSYIYHSSEDIFVDRLNITSTPGVATFILTPGKVSFPNLEIKGVYTSFKILINSLKNTKLDRYQVLINLDKEYLVKEFRNYDLLKTILYPQKRKNYYVAKNSVEIYYSSKFGEISIVSPLTVFTFLEKYYLDPELRLKDGKWCKERILAKCNAKSIITSFIKFLEF